MNNLYVIMNLNRCGKKDLWQTQWPNWVYKQFDVNYLALRAAEKATDLFKI